jgi:hypothetical protein
MKRFNYRLDFLFATVSALAAFLPPFMLGRNGFLIFDFSVVVDAGWRIANGQWPHVDFVIPSGPICFVLQAFFFKVCGSSLYAPIIHAALLNGFATLLAYGLVRKASNPYLALGTGLATAAWFYLPYSFPWYDTTAFLFVLLSQAVFELGCRKKEGAAFSSSFFMGMLIGLCFLSKQNIGLFAVLLYGVLLWHSTGLKKPGRALYFTLGFTVVVGGYLLINTLADGGAWTIEGLFIRPALMGRGRKFLSPVVWTRILTAWPMRILAAAMVLVVLHALWHKPRGKAFWDSLDLIGLLGMSILSAFTGTGSTYLFLPLLGLCAGLFSARNLRGGSKGIPPISGRLGGIRAGVLLLLFVLFTAWGFRVGISRVTKGYALKNCGFNTDYPLTAENLKPFTMHRRLGSALDDAVMKLQEREAARDGFFVFPNTTVLYIALGYVSPVPYVWIHPQQSFFSKSLGDEERLIEALRRTAPKWIVLWNYHQKINNVEEYKQVLDRKDHQMSYDRADLMMALMPRLRAFIEDEYLLDHEASCFRILKKKGP